MDFKEKIKELARQFTVPTEDKLEKRMHSLERMSGFYETKIEGAPERQANMFKGFVITLAYAMTIIKMHRSVTKALKELAEEADNEERSNT